jgi:hypothetical protein
VSPEAAEKFMIRATARVPGGDGRDGLPVLQQLISPNRRIHLFEGEGARRSSPTMAALRAGAPASEGLVKCILVQAVVTALTYPDGSEDRRKAPVK